MYQIDETDIKILELLKQNGRCSYSDIAVKVHLSRVAVRERIKIMEENNVILGYTVLINSYAYNKFASVFLEIEVAPQLIARVAQQIAAIKDVAIVSQHTGLSSLHVHAYIDKIENLSDYLTGNFYSIEGIRNIQSYVLLKSYKTTTYLTLPPP
ncbi:MAG: Lrp/AsnC family transcriptional regulator [Bacillota bacterium]|jgi:Lrp/AsnC family leucine-responsive transcriptional regulator